MYGIRGGSATFASIFICFCILISVFISVCIFLFVAFPFYGTLCVAMRFAVSVLNIFPFRLSLRISTFVFILNFGFHFDSFVTSKSKWKANIPYMESHYPAMVGDDSDADVQPSDCIGLFLSM